MSDVKLELATVLLRGYEKQAAPLARFIGKAFPKIGRGLGKIFGRGAAKAERAAVGAERAVARPHYQPDPPTKWGPMTRHSREKVQRWAEAEKAGGPLPADHWKNTINQPLRRNTGGSAARREQISLGPAKVEEKPIKPWPEEYKPGMSRPWERWKGYSPEDAARMIEDRAERHYQAVKLLERRAGRAGGSAARREQISLGPAKAETAPAGSRRTMMESLSPEWRARWQALKLAPHSVPGPASGGLDAYGRYAPVHKRMWE